MNEKEKVALGSIAASAGLTAAKAVVGLLTGSLAILSEAGHSLLDLSATVLTYFAVRISGKPADAEHQYGHGKVESVTALAETALLFVLTAIVIFEAVRRLTGAHAHAVEATIAAFVVIVGSVFICTAGYRLGRGTIDTLTDTAPAGVRDHIGAIARQVPGVVKVERVRARPAGAVLFVELGVAISRTLPFDRVSAIKQQLTDAIRSELPAAELTITTEPKALDDETVRERVMVIARDLGLAIHHVAVQTIAGRLSVSVDLEVDGALPLAAAHDVASRLEEAIGRELGPDVEVETHIEPLPADLLAGTDADPVRIGRVREVLTSLAAELPALGEVHDVRVRDTGAGEIVNFHCQVDPALSVSTVHDMVDALERRLRRQFPTIQRVIGHAEPRR